MNFSEKESKPTEKMPVQSIVQKACALVTLEYNIVNQGRKDREQNGIELTKRIREQIELYGGVDQIDAILEKNDPGHSFLNTVLENLDRERWGL